MQKFNYAHRLLGSIAALTAVVAVPTTALGADNNVIDPNVQVSHYGPLMTLPPCDNENGLTEVFSVGMAESSVTFNRHNEDFQKTGEFTVTAQSYTYEVVEQHRTPVYIAETTVGFGFACTLAEAESMFSDTSMFTREVHDGQTWWIEEWFWAERYGKRFPAQYYMYDGTKVYQCRINYEEIGEYTDEWISDEPYTEDCSQNFGIYTYLDGNGYYVKDFQVLSKHFFNTDDNYEYLITEHTYQEKIEDETIDYRRVKKGYFPSAYLIKNDNGETIGRLPYSDNGGICFANLNKNHYVGVGNSEGESQWFKVAKTVNGSSLMPVAKLPISVSPRIAQRSTPITVKVPANDNERRTVSVVSLAGRTVLTKSLSPNTDTLDIDTSNFAPGVYIVNVANGSSVTENCKIVIR